MALFLKGKTGAGVVKLEERRARRKEMMNLKQKKSVAGAIVLAVTAVAIVGIASRSKTESSEVQSHRDSTETAVDVGVTNRSPVEGDQGNNDALRQLMQPASDIKERMPYSSEAERVEWVERNKRLARLWMERDKRDVSHEIAAYLEDRDPHLRDRAAKALGRLDSDEVELILENKWQKQKAAEEQRQKQRGEHKEDTDVSVWTLRLARGRTKGRRLKGKDKLQEVAQSVGITLEQATVLMRELRKPWSNGVRIDETAGEVVKELVDLAYTMGKNGEDIQPLRKNWFNVGPALDLKLKGANLPKEEEIKAAVDYAAQPDSGSYVEDYLVELGPRATEMLVERLQQIEQSPQKDQTDWNYISMFRAVADMGDPRVEPLLKKFENSKSSEVNSYASSTLHDLQLNRSFPRLPA